MSETFNPAACTVVKALLKSYDGSKQRDLSANFVGGFEINQSMDTAAWSGALSILDTIGVLEDMPIRGEETLELEIVSHDLDTKIKLRTVVHAVSDIQPTATGNGLTYKLHFISDTSFKSSTNYVTKAYRTSVDQIALNIFENNFRSVHESVTTDPNDITRTLPFQTRRFPLQNTDPVRNFYLQATAGVHQLVVPRLMSPDAMFFIGARAFSNETPSQTYRFFETLENYYFCTDEYFLKDIKQNQELSLWHGPVADFTPDKAASQINRLDNIRVISRGINSSDDMLSGAYKSEVIELDFIRRKKETLRFDYDKAKFSDMTGSAQVITERNQPHTQEYKNQIFNYNNAKKFMETEILFQQH
jgi:hypothetical protein